MKTPEKGITINAGGKKAKNSSLNIVKNTTSAKPLLPDSPPPKKPPLPGNPKQPKKPLNG